MRSLNSIVIGCLLILVSCGKRESEDKTNSRNTESQPQKMGEGLRSVSNIEGATFTGTDPKEYLLLGFDSITGLKRNEECVKFKGREDLPPRGANPPVDRSFSAQYGSTRQELERQISFSNSAKLSLGFGSIGAAERISRTYTTSSEHKHLLISTIVKYDSRVVDLAEGVELTDKAKGYLAEGNFFSKCGDSFIVGDILGGEFNAIYLFSSFKDSSIRVMHNQVEAAVTAINLGVKADFVNRLKTVSASANGAVDVLSSGPGDTVERTYDGLWKYGTEFAARVKANPTVVEYVIESYQGLVGSKHWDKWAKHRDATHKYEAALLALRDREDALGELLTQGHGELGYTPEPDAATELTELRTLTASAKETLKLCVKNGDCDAVAPLPEPQAKPPGPLVATYVVPSDGSAQLLIREPNVVVELLGRWTAVKGKSGVACDRVDCTWNQFVFMNKADGTLFTSVANKTCLSPGGYDVYYRPVVAGLSKIAPKVGDPVRVLTYHPIYPKKAMCTWEPPK